MFLIPSYIWLSLFACRMQEERFFSHYSLVRQNEKDCQKKNKNRSMDHMYYHVTMEGKFPSIIWDSDLSCLITSDSCYYFWINISAGTLRRKNCPCTWWCLHFLLVAPRRVLCVHARMRVFECVSVQRPAWEIWTAVRSKESIFL